MCSPNADADNRMCQTCFDIPQLDGAVSDSSSDDEAIYIKQNNRRIIDDENSSSDSNSHEQSNESSSDEESEAVCELYQMSWGGLMYHIQLMENHMCF